MWKREKWKGKGNERLPINRYAVAFYLLEPNNDQQLFAQLDCQMQMSMSLKGH